MSSADLQERIEAIEAGYEYMLAYAAQGYEAGQAGSHADEVRARLTAMDQALEGLGDAVGAVARAQDGDGAGDYEAFLQAVATDAARAQGAVRLVLKRGGISSQLIDNFNASTHVRAVLTDLFLVDEAFNGN